MPQTVRRPKKLRENPDFLEEYVDNCDHVMYPKEEVKGLGSGRILGCRCELNSTFVIPESYTEDTHRAAEGV